MVGETGARNDDCRGADVSAGTTDAHAVCGEAAKLAQPVTCEKWCRVPCEKCRALCRNGMVAAAGDRQGARVPCAPAVGYLRC